MTAAQSTKGHIDLSRILISMVIYSGVGGVGRCMGGPVSPSFASPGWSLVRWLNIRLHQEPVLHKVTPSFKATTTTKTQQQKKQQPSTVSDCMHFCISVLGFDERHREIFFLKKQPSRRRRRRRLICCWHNLQGTALTAAAV